MGGATKPHHVKGTAKAVNLTLSEEEYASLEELYAPIPFYNKYHPQEDFGLDPVENWKGPRR